MPITVRQTPSSGSSVMVTRRSSARRGPSRSGRSHSGVAESAHIRGAGQFVPRLSAVRDPSCQCGRVHALQQRVFCGPLLVFLGDKASQR